MQFRFVVPYRVLIYDHLSQSFPLNHRMCHSLMLTSFNVLMSRQVCFKWCFKNISTIHAHPCLFIQETDHSYRRNDMNIQNKGKIDFIEDEWEKWTLSMQSLYVFMFSVRCEWKMYVLAFVLTTINSQPYCVSTPHTRLLPRITIHSILLIEQTW